MSVPKSVVKFKKDNVTYTSSVDHALYNIQELTRRAMYDIGKYIVRKANDEAAKLKGMKPKGGNWHGTSHRVRGKTSTFKYNVPFVENGLPYLQVGVKHDTWYGVGQELGKKGMKKLGILRNTVYNNISTIREIESKYLTGVNTEEDVTMKDVMDEGE